MPKKYIFLLICIAMLLYIPVFTTTFSNAEKLKSLERHVLELEMSHNFMLRKLEDVADILIEKSEWDRSVAKEIQSLKREIEVLPFLESNTLPKG